MQFKKNYAFLLILGFAILIFSCGKETIEDLKEPRDIYFVEFNNETEYFKDTTISYDFNNDSENDFQIDVTWKIDSSISTITIDVDETIQMLNRQTIVNGWGELNIKENRSFQLNDSIRSLEDIQGISYSSGGFKNVFTPTADFNWIEEMEAEEKYWAFSLAVGNKLHFGWLKLKFSIIEEIGFNQIPNQAIAIGQKE